MSFKQIAIFVTVLIVAGGIGVGVYFAVDLGSEDESTTVEPTTNYPITTFPPKAPGRFTSVWTDKPTHRIFKKMSKYQKTSIQNNHRGFE